MEYYDKDAVLETERLILRPLREEDTSAIWRNINHDREVLRYFLDTYVEEEKDASLTRVINYCAENKRYLFAIVLKETEEVIGMLLQCSDMNRYFHTLELGYAIGRPYWHQGYTSEALKRVIEFLFEKGVPKLICSAITENTHSIGVMKKCGMIYEGRKINEIYYHDRYWDCDTYYLWNPDVPRETSPEND